MGECLLWKEDLLPRLVFMNAKVKVNGKAMPKVMAEYENLVNLYPRGHIQKE